MDSVRQILESGGDPAVLLVYAQRLVLGRTFASIGNLGTLTLATRLRRRGFNAVAYTAISSDVMKLLAGLRRKPFAVGFYCDFDNQSVVRALCSRIRAANGNAVRILIGGPQTFHMAADDVERYSADVIFRGDGENSLEAWLEAELAGQPTTLSNAMTVRNRTAGYRQESSPGDEAAPDDSLAFSADIRHRMMSVITARGCPHRCAFCFEGGASKNFRQRPVGSVLTEVRERLGRFPGPRYVFFADDTFTATPERTLALAKGLGELRRDHDFIWFCEGHAAFFRRYPDVLPAMIDSGLARMQIGMESGDQKVLDAYGKGITPDDVLAATEASSRHGLTQLAGNFIVGGAFETRETLARTICLARDILEAAPGMVELSTTFVMPLPGTSVTKEPERFGIVMDDEDFVSSIEDYPVNGTRALSVAEVCGARRELVAAISGTMRRQFAEGRIDGDRIAADYRLAIRYGIIGAYLRFLYMHDAGTHACYSLLASSRLKEWKDVEPEQAPEHIPVRVGTIRDLAEEADGLDDAALDFLLACGSADVNGMAARHGGIGNVLALCGRLGREKRVLFAEGGAFREGKE